MIKPKNVLVRSVDADHLEISWETNTSAMDTLAYKFYVLRGESPEGPYETVGGPLIDQYSFRDYTAPMRGSQRTLYYIVRAEDLSSGEQFNSQPTNPEPRPPLDALEIMRRNDLLFREFTGRPCVLYSVRTFGQRCTDCYDNITGRRTASSCMLCWNTGYLRGYHKPIIVYVQIDPTSKSLQIQAPFVGDPSQVQARMGVYPILKARDVLVERENIRWRVINISRTERLRAPVRQEISLTQIPRGDIEFNIPLEWPDIETSPRSYSYRTDI